MKNPEISMAWDIDHQPLGRQQRAMREERGAQQGWAVIHPHAAFFARRGDTGAIQRDPLSLPETAGQFVIEFNAREF